MDIGKLGFLSKIKTRFTKNDGAQDPIKQPDYPTYGIKGGDGIKPLEKDSVAFKKAKIVVEQDAVQSDTETTVEEAAEEAKPKKNLAFAQSEAQYGDKALGEWNLEEALEAYTNAIDHGLDTPEIYYKRGYVNEYLSNLPEAIADYGESIARNDEAFQSYVNRAETEMYYMHSLPPEEKEGAKGKGLIKSAIQDYGKALMLEIPEDEKQIVRDKILNDLIKTQNLTDEEIEYVLTGEGNPTRRNVEYYREDYLKAIEDFKNFIPYAQNPTVIDLVAEVYGYYGGEGRIGASCYERSTEINEANLKDAEARLETAQTEEEKEQINQEIAELKTTLAREYKLAGYYYKANEGMDWCMFDDKVFKFYQRGLELEPDTSADAFYRLGMVAPTHEERVEYLEKAIELSPEEPTYRERLTEELRLQLHSFDSEEQEREYYHAVGVQGMLDCKEEVSPEALERAETFAEDWHERWEDFEGRIADQETTATVLRIQQNAEEKKKTQQIQHTETITGA